MSLLQTIGLWFVVSIVVSLVLGAFLRGARRLGKQENKRLRRIREAGL